MKSIKRLTFFFLLVLVAFGCRKEIKVDRNDVVPDLVYEPYGKNNNTTRVVSAQNQAVVVQIHDYLIHHISKKVLEPDWTYHASRSILNFIHTSANHTLTVELDWPIGFGYLSINRIDESGKLIYSAPWSDKMIPQHPYFSEELLAICGDGKNGAYALIYMEDMNGGQPAKRFLVHFNDKNVIDLRKELTDFYVYLQCDGSGQIFLTRSISAMGDFLRLQTLAYDEAELLQNKNLKSIWNHSFTATEIDWKFIRYNPYHFTYSNNNLYFIKPDHTGANDEARGIEYIQINSQTGAEVKRFYIPFGTNYNHWQNPATFHSIITTGEHIIAYNFIGNSRITAVDLEGNIKWTRMINGNENNTLTTGIAFMDNRLFIFGNSTLKKGLIAVPFIYNFKPD